MEFVIPGTANLWLFIAAAVALLVVPGPAVLYIVARSVEQGRLAGFVSDLGATPVANPPSEFAAFVKQDTEKWRALVATAKIQVEQ